MDLVTCEKNPGYPGDFPLREENAPLVETLQLLVFAIERKYFAIDLTEVRDIVREARMKHPDSVKPSIVRGIIRRNRRNTIVINLNRCLRIQWGFDIDERNTGILVLDEKVGDSTLGILVTGISSIVTVKYSRLKSDPVHAGKDILPIHGVIRKTGSGIFSGNGSPIIWIDLRSLVNNCSSGDLFADGESELVRIADL